MGREVANTGEKMKIATFFTKLKDQTSRNTQISTLIVNRIGVENIRCGDVNWLLVSVRVKLQIPLKSRNFF
jgi:hypothetical protein